MMYSLCCELIGKQIRARMTFRLCISYTHVILRTYTLTHSKMWLPWLLSNNKTVWSNEMMWGLIIIKVYVYVL